MSPFDNGRQQAFLEGGEKLQHLLHSIHLFYHPVTFFAFPKLMSVISPVQSHYHEGSPTSKKKN